MSARKEDLRKIVLDIIFEKEKTKFDPWQMNNLLAGVAEVLDRRTGRGGFEHRLEPEDKMIVLEVFWDLFIERIVTVGKDAANDSMPSFRLHSDARSNANRGIS